MFSENRIPGVLQYINEVIYDLDSKLENHHSPSRLQTKEILSSLRSDISEICVSNALTNNRVHKMVNRCLDEYCSEKSFEYLGNDLHFGVDKLLGRIIPTLKNYYSENEDLPKISCLHL